MRDRVLNSGVIAWSMYDFANSAFATTVMAGFFPIFFKQYWSLGTDVTTSTFYLGLANSVAGIVVAAASPLLGAIADTGGNRRKFLLFFTMMGIVMTGALSLVAQGDWPFAAALFVIAIIGFSGANTFYDSLILCVTRPSRADFVSAFGYALGYLGGGILFALNVAMTQSPQFFGLSDAGEAVRWSFLMVAVWWAVFAIPLFVFVREPAATGAPGRDAIAGGLRQMAATFRHIRSLRVVALFLAGYWLYIDGVGTIISMAVDYGLSIGFDSGTLIVALLITQLVGFPAAIAFGVIGERYGAKSGIFAGIAVYIGVVVWAYQMNTAEEFYVLAAIIGLVQGGVQSLSRSLYSRLIPTDKSAEFFGFYNMIGKFATFLGPAVMGSVSLVTGNPRYSILSLIAFFVAGAVILYFVDEREGQRVAQRL